MHGLGLLGQLIHFLRQVVHIGFLDQVSDLLGGHGAFDLQVRSDIAEELEYSRHFALGQQVYLQVEMRPLVGLSGQPILACEHEQRQEDGFE